MPRIDRLLETALYVDDLERVAAFYRDVPGLTVLIDAAPRLVAMDAGQASILLLFKRGEATAGQSAFGGWIPPHDGNGPAHVAFAVSVESLSEWERHLTVRGIAIESRVRWESGGQSIYFRDPAGHSVELATPGTWPVY